MMGSPPAVSGDEGQDLGGPGGEERWRQRACCRMRSSCGGTWWNGDASSGDGEVVRVLLACGDGGVEEGFERAERSTCFRRSYRLAMLSSTQQSSGPCPATSFLFIVSTLKLAQTQKMNMIYTKNNLVTTFSLLCVVLLS
jgi:hypothetical protein